jgi:hypothetical protein
MRNEESDQSLLREIVIKHSVADNWFQAKAEWQLMTIYDKWSKCICRHRIRENCVIQNKKNFEELVVGNVCINHFKEDNLSVEKSCRTSLRRLQASPNTAKANTNLIKLAVKLDILSEAEAKNYNKYRTSNKDFARKMRVKINHLIRYGFSADRPRCGCDHFAKPRKSGQGGYFYSCASGFYEANGTKRKRWNNVCGFSQDID